MLLGPQQTIYNQVILTRGSIFDGISNDWIAFWFKNMGLKSGHFVSIFLLDFSCGTYGIPATA
jgi:hypothetical protein